MGCGTSSSINQSQIIQPKRGQAVVKVQTENGKIFQLVVVLYQTLIQIKFQIELLIGTSWENQQLYYLNNAEEQLSDSMPLHQSEYKNGFLIKTVPNKYIFSESNQSLLCQTENSPQQQKNKRNISYKRHSEKHLTDIQNTINLWKVEQQVNQRSVMQNPQTSHSDQNDIEINVKVSDNNNNSNESCNSDSNIISIKSIENNQNNCQNPVENNSSNENSQQEDLNLTIQKQIILNENQEKNDINNSQQGLFVCVQAKKIIFIDIPNFDTETMFNFKHRVFNLSGIYPNSQTYLFQGKILIDDQDFRISELGINSGDTLNLDYQVHTKPQYKQLLNSIDIQQMQYQQYYNQKNKLQYQQLMQDQDKNQNDQLNKQEDLPRSDIDNQNKTNLNQNINQQKQLQPQQQS